MCENDEKRIILKSINLRARGCDEMAQRILFDKEEAAILLEFLTKSLKGMISRSEAIASVSKELRDRAERKGIEVDDTFRTEDGIATQMRVMEYIFTNGQRGFRKSSMPRLFQDIVYMHNNDYNAYENLLKEARSMMQEEKSIQDQFALWLAQKVSSERLSDLYILFDDIEDFCMKRKTLKHRLFETTDLDTIKVIYNTVSSNKLFYYMHRKNIKKMIAAIKLYYDFVKEISQESITEQRNDLAEKVRTDIVEKIDVQQEEKSVQAQFDAWLVDRVQPTYRNKVYVMLENIEKFCIQRKMLRKKLLETTNLLVVKEIMDMMTSNLMFRYTYGQNTPKMGKAIKLYYDFLQELKKNSDLNVRNQPKEEKRIEKAVPIENESREKVEKSIQEQFALWLSKRVYPTRYKELYATFEDIESFCMKRNILKQKLFETTNLNIIKEVIDTVTTNKMFQYLHRAKLTDSSVAIRTYYKFLEQHSAANRDKRDVKVENPIKTTVKKDRTHDFIMVGKAEDSVKATVEKIPVVKEEKTIFDTGKKEEKTIDFSINVQKVDAQPISFSYFGEDQGIVDSWSQLYVKIVACLFNDYPKLLRYLVNSNIDNQGAIDFADASMKHHLNNPQKVSWDFYLETGISNEDIILNVKSLLEICKIDYENVEIKYMGNVVGQNSETETKKMDEFNSGENGSQFNDKENQDVVKENHIEYTATRKVPVENREETIDFFSDISDVKIVSTKSISFSYFGEEQGVVKTWDQLYEKVVSCLFEDYPGVFNDLINKSISGQGKNDFADSKKMYMMKAPRKISADFYLETYFNAETIVAKIKSLLDICKIDYENIEIKYVENDIGQSSKTEDKHLNASVSTKARTQFLRWMYQSGRPIKDIASDMLTIERYSKYACEMGICTTSLFAIADVNELKRIQGELAETPTIKAYAEGRYSIFKNVFDILLDYRSGNSLHVMEENSQVKETISVSNSRLMEINKAGLDNTETRTQFVTQFSEWMKQGGYTTDVIAENISAISQYSEYANQKKICKAELFTITDTAELTRIRNKLADTAEVKAYAEVQKRRFYNAFYYLVLFRFNSNSHFAKKTEKTENATSPSKNKSVEVKKEVSNIDNIIKEKSQFREWMKQAGYTTDVIVKNISAISMYSDDANRKGICKTELFTIPDIAELKRIRNELSETPEVKAYTEEQYHVFQNAFNNLLNCRLGDAGGGAQLEAAVKSSNNNLMEIKKTSIEVDDSPKASIQFIEWMKNAGHTTAIIMGVVFAISHYSKLANKKGICSAELFDITDTTEIRRIRNKLAEMPEYEAYTEEQKRRFRDVFYNLLNFRLDTKSHVSTPTIQNKVSVEVPTASARENSSMNDEISSRYTIILTKYFNDGKYKLGNSISIARFKKHYASEFGCELTDSKEKIDKILLKVGTERDGRIFPKQDEDQNSLIEEILNDIYSVLKNGISAVYKEAVFSKYQQQLAEKLQIYHVDGLTELVIKNAKGRFNPRHSYFSLGWNSAESTKDILKIMEEVYQPQSYEEIHKKAWYIPYDKMKQCLSAEKSIVNVATGTYFYAPNLPISAEEKRQLASIIQSELAYRSHITDVELIALINEKCPSVIVNTAGFTTYGLRNCLGYIFRDRFSFNGPIISSIGHKISMNDVFAEFARMHDTFYIDALKNFASEMNTSIYWDSVMREMVRVSENEFVRKDLISFDVTLIDDILKEMCSENYMSLKDVSLFLHFPNIGYSWNLYVLESYLYHSSKEFKLLHASFCQNDVCGAMVKVNSGIEDYRELMVDVLSKSNALESTQAALQYIVMRGFQQRRAYSGIEKIVREAKLIKEKREKEEK